MVIHLFKPKLPTLEFLSPYIKRIDESQKYTNFGPLVNELHSRLAKYFGVKTNSLVSLANATLALEGCVEVTQSKNEWLSPSFTFSATNLSLKRVGAKFWLGDVDEDWRLKDKVEFRNVMDVCPFGDSIDLTRFNQKKDYLVIDAAASFDSLRNCGEILLNADYPIGVVVSFHATKILPGAEGGVFFSNRTDWVDEVRQWSTFGMKDSRCSDKDGTNAKMHEYSAAVILASLDSWETTRKSWIELKNIALEICQKNQIQAQPVMKKEFATPYWIIRSSEEVVSLIERVFGEMEIETRRWWEFGCHNMNAFENTQKFTLSQTEVYAKETLGLPFHLNLKKSELAKIQETLEKCVSYVN